MLPACIMAHQIKTSVDVNRSHEAQKRLVLQQLHAGVWKFAAFIQRAKAFAEQAGTQDLALLEEIQDLLLQGIDVFHAEETDGCTLLQCFGNYGNASLESLQQLKDGISIVISQVPTFLFQHLIDQRRLHKEMCESRKEVSRGNFSSLEALCEEADKLAAFIEKLQEDLEPECSRADFALVVRELELALALAPEHECSRADVFRIIDGNHPAIDDTCGCWAAPSFLLDSSHWLNCHSLEQTLLCADDASQKIWV